MPCSLSGSSRREIERPPHEYVIDRRSLRCRLTSRLPRTRSSMCSQIHYQLRVGRGGLRDVEPCPAPAPRPTSAPHTGQPNQRYPILHHPRSGRTPSFHTPTPHHALSQTHHSNSTLTGRGINTNSNSNNNNSRGWILLQALRESNVYSTACAARDKQNGTRPLINRYHNAAWRDPQSTGSREPTDERLPVALRRRRDSHTRPALVLVLVYDHIVVRFLLHN